jgi:hypothetical protein
MIMDVTELGQGPVFGVSDAGPSGSDTTEVVFCVCTVSCGRTVVKSQLPAVQPSKNLYD